MSGASPTKRATASAAQVLGMYSSVIRLPDDQHARIAAFGFRAREITANCRHRIVLEAKSHAGRRRRRHFVLRLAQRYTRRRNAQEAAPARRVTAVVLKAHRPTSVSVLLR